MKKILCVLGVLWLTGCSSIPEAKLSVPLLDSSTKVKLVLESSGHIIVSNQLKPSFEKCERLKGLFSVSIEDQNEDSPIPMNFTCNFLKGQLSAVSKNILQKGT